MLIWFITNDKLSIFIGDMYVEFRKVDFEISFFQLDLCMQNIKVCKQSEQCKCKFTYFY